MFRRVLLLSAALAAASATSAYAQYARGIGDLISRPGSRGPSAQLGGRYTSAEFRPLESTRRDVALLGSAGFAFRGPTTLTTQADVLPMVQVGLRSGVASGNMLSRTPMDFADQASILSGLHRATSLYNPLVPMSAEIIPRLDAYLYTPRPTGTRFHALVGLAPTREAPPAAVAPLAARLTAQTNAWTAQKERQGLQLFRAATVEVPQQDPVTGAMRYANCTDCVDNLIRAEAELRFVRDIEPKNALAPLLLAHIAMQQERPLTAAYNLLAAFSRNEALFAGEGSEVGPYFGDATAAGESSYLEAQVRRYRTVGELNPGSSAANVVQAYCAWRAGDTARATSALDRLDGMVSTEQPQMGQILASYANAVRVAIGITRLPAP